MLMRIGNPPSQYDSSSAAQCCEDAPATLLSKTESRRKAYECDPPMICAALNGT